MAVNSVQLETFEFGFCSLISFLPLIDFLSQGLFKTDELESEADEDVSGGMPVLCMTPSNSLLMSRVRWLLVSSFALPYN